MSSRGASSSQHIASIEFGSGTALNVRAFPTSLKKHAIVYRVTFGVRKTASGITGQFISRRQNSRDGSILRVNGI